MMLEKFMSLLGLIGKGNIIEKPCLIVGTGPSMRLFEAPEINQYGLIIGLNRAYEVFPVDCTITIHAHELFQESLQQTYLQTGCLITKPKGNSNHWSRKAATRLDAERRVALFDGNADPHDFSYCETRTPNKLYLGRGIQATAITLAAHLGFESVILIGCDMADLDGDHHAIQNHHIRTHGLSTSEIYREYYECTARVREIVYRNFGTRVYTLSPFLGLGREQEDYKLLKSQLGLEPIGSQEDTSSYDRPNDRFL